MGANRVPARYPRRGFSDAAVLIFRGFVLAAAGLLAASCSFNYGESLAEDLEDRIPDAVFTGFTHRIVQDNEPILVLSAERAEFFDRKNLVRLEGVRFEELRDGEPLAVGSSDFAVLRTDTEDAEFTGSVFLRSQRDGVTIRSGYLSWTAEDRILESGPDQVTSIQKDDGSGLTGSGFRADARRKGVDFSGKVEGILVRPAPEQTE